MRDELAPRVDDVAWPAWPILICETTSQMNLRFTSATVTPWAGVPPDMLTVMYGSDSLRKYTGLKYVRPLAASRNRGSLE